jgi:hypothetical protein
LVDAHRATHLIALTRACASLVIHAGDAIP